VTNLRIFGDIITGNLEVAGELYTPFLFRNGEWILLQGIDPKINTVDFVDGDRIVGQYGILDNTLIRPGYVLQLDALAADEVPEPASILAWSLIAMGAFAYQRVRKQVVRAHRR
jgi:hypothetical protein